MSIIYRFQTSQLCCRFGFAVLALCSLATLARADDQTLRTTYPDFSSTSHPSESSHKLEFSQFGNQSYKPSNKVEPSASQTPAVIPVTPSSPIFGTSAAGNSPTPPAFGNSFSPSTAGSSSDIPAAVRKLIGPAHLPSAMQNPATMPFQGGESDREAEHQRVLNNMRAHGYSQERINSLEPYIHQTEEPGMTYRNVMGIKVRNDGMTAGQAFSNVKNSGLMNTPINADLHVYQPGTYGYYRGMGGTKTFGQWLDGQSTNRCQP